MDLINFKVESLKSVLPYLRQNEYVKAIIDVISAQYEDLQDALYALCLNLHIRDARGVWLDMIGREVGAQRDEKDFGSFFCVNRKHINEEMRFYFLSSGENPESPLTLDDAEFIQKIFAYIGANSSCGTRNENIEIIKTITNADHVYITRTAPCSLKIQLAGSALILTKNTISYIRQVLGDGVNIEDIIY